MPKEYTNWKIPSKNSKLKTKNQKLPDWFLSILAGRGIDNARDIKEYLNPDYKKLPRPSVFLNMIEAVERVAGAKESNERVIVYGDYDVDGITATALVYEALAEIGIEAETYIPHREEEGYGLNDEALADIKSKGVKLVIAVDCGVSAGPLIDAEGKLDFIVIDHHTIDPDKLPKRAIVLHPSLVTSGDGYQLSAAGLAYFWAVALMDHYPSEFMPGQEKWLLDLVALSIICDIMPLTGVNRVLTHFGLLVLNKTKRVGLVELIKIAGAELGTVDSYTVGFLLGPRLNAAGRLESAQKSLELLITQDKGKGRSLAAELNKLNSERQQLCERIIEEARQQIEAGDKEAPINLLSDRSWPRGVVGIVASRMTDIYNRPTIIFENDGEMHHGSARSVDGLNITELLGEVSDHTVKFGGHAKAAGVTVSDEHFILFKEKLIALVGEKLKTIEVKEDLIVDAIIKPGDVSDEAMALLAKLEPTGFGNKRPVLAMLGTEVGGISRVGKNKEHLKFSILNSRLSPNTSNLPAVAFSEPREIEVGKKYDFTLTLKYNTWNNRKTIEARVIDFRSAE